MASFASKQHCFNNNNVEAGSALALESSEMAKSKTKSVKYEHVFSRDCRTFQSLHWRLDKSRSTSIENDNRGDTLQRPIATIASHKHFQGKDSRETIMIGSNT